MIRRDMLASYTQIEAVAHALRRISAHLAARWGRSFELEAAVVDLQTHHDAFAADFAEFFPQLQAHVEKIRDASRGGA
jgi:acyl carrier protein phosphodiesterase